MIYLHYISSILFLFSMFLKPFSAVSLYSIVFALFLWEYGTSIYTLYYSFIMKSHNLFLSWTFLSKIFWMLFSGLCFSVLFFNQFQVSFVFFIVVLSTLGVCRANKKGVCVDGVGNSKLATLINIFSKSGLKINLDE